MNKFKAWLQAARLRTLPLSVSGIIVGTTLANISGYSDSLIFLLALLTTIGFQITSNFANDYGDGVKGTDNEERIGPKRMLQSGALNRRELKNGIWISVIVNLMLVAVLLYLAFGIDQIHYTILFALLGIFSIWSAVKYTVGDTAYGYLGLGDLFVFVFFGLLSVLGSLFLYGQSLFPAAILPASTIGLLSTAVLNLNNMRDLETDKKVGKRTMAVILGPEKSRVYHYVLILGSLVCMIVFSLNYAASAWHWIPLLAYVPLLLHLRKMSRIKEATKLDPELKKIALSTFLLSLLFYFTYNFL